MGYTSNHGLVRLDIYTPEGRWHATDELDMTDFGFLPNAREAVLAAIRAQNRWDLQAWTFSVSEPWHTERVPVLIQCTNQDQGQVNTVEDGLRDLLSSLYLYVGRHAWTQLSGVQKELFADVIDAEWRKDPDMAGSAVERWWRG